ncbi:MAG: HAD-IA family hydrolase [Candidatus Omnitrophica bacterium]|nr:HAD-IA family hydrolase [Candidatus Omnitrophota bacterium]
MRKKIKFAFKAVIFDMDGVITNTMPDHFNAWLATFAAIGIKVSCYDIYEREGQDGLTSVREITKKYGIKISAKETRRILAQKERLFKRIVKVRFVKGARPFIRLLKKRKFLLGLVTGTASHEVRRIMPKKLLKMFNVIVTGDRVKKSKPHPEPFLKAIRMLKVRPGQAAVLENAPFGIKSAKRAGLFCIAMQTSLPVKYLAGADALFKSYAQLRKTLHIF